MSKPHRFKLVSKFEAAGDQPKAIEELIQGIIGGEKHQVQVTVVEAQRLQEGEALNHLLEHPLHVLPAGLQM